MVTLQQAETEIAKHVEDLNANMKLGVKVNSDFCPGSLFDSKVLITIINRLGKALKVDIPDNCYIFHDKKAHKQLSIKEAAIKLIKEAKNAK